MVLSCHSPLKNKVGIIHIKRRMKIKATYPYSAEFVLIVSTIYITDVTSQNDSKWSYSATLTSTRRNSDTITTNPTTSRTSIGRKSPTMPSTSLPHCYDNRYHTVALTFKTSRQ